MMSERMLELELEAIAYADSKVPARDRYNDIYHAIVRRKFAELIVGECAEVLVTWNRENGAEEGLDKAGLISLWSPHFGVEE